MTTDATVKSKPPSKLVGEKPTPDGGLTQSERLIKAAQELRTDDDSERFKVRVAKRPKVYGSQIKPFLRDRLL